MVSFGKRPEPGRPRRGLVTALFVAILLVAGTGLYVSAAPLITGEGDRPARLAVPTGSPTPTAAVPTPAPSAAKPARKAPALPPVDAVPETRRNTVRPARCPAPPPAPPATSATAAYPNGSRLRVHTSPDGPLRQTLANPTRDGMVLVVLVRRIRGDWALVQLPQRPNGSTGWIRLADVTTYQAVHRAVVELCAHRLTVYRGGKVVMQETVAVGAPQWPTPTGEFYVDFQWQTGRPRGGYGPWLLSIAGYSNVLKTFAGGIGQIAFHGTNAPWSIGRSVSHGCIRLRNDAIVRLQKIAVPGTPVTIVP